MSSKIWGHIVGCALLACAGSAHGAVVTVDTSTDPIDIDWQTATIADLPGPDGKVSFSEAMIVTSNTPGPDTIEFAIPQSEWIFQFVYPGCAVIVSSYTFFWRSSDELTIDGTSQTAFTGDTNPDGCEVAFYGDEFFLSGSGSEVRGIHGGAFTLAGSNMVASGNTGGVNITVAGGSGNLIQDNVCGTIKLDRTSDNVVVGNTMNRVRVLGGGPAAQNNRVGGPDLADRNFITGYGYVNSEGLPAGAAVQIAASNGTVIENNWIGTTPDGLAQGNLACTMGVSLEGENHDTFIRNNRIAGVLGQGQNPHHAGQVFGWAIHISGSGSALSIHDNTIGLNADDQPVLGSVTGVEVGTWSYFGIDGITIEDNVIAGHLFNGITVGRDVAAARIARNAIFDNGQLGIDLVPTGFGFGPTPNDPLDPDTGGNGLQNFPVLAAAEGGGATVTVTGSLHSAASSSYTLDFFLSPACDDAGFGEGQQYLGSTSVMTDGAGDAVFDVALAGTAPEGWVATTTATLEPAGATSEFSSCVPVAQVVTAAPEGSPSVLARLLGVQPNPFNPRTTIRYALTAPARVQLKVFDVRGRLVRVLERGERSVGTHVVQWDGRDDGGAEVPSGVYFANFHAGSVTESRKMLLLR